MERPNEDILHKFIDKRQKETSGKAFYYVVTIIFIASAFVRLAEMIFFNVSFSSFCLLFLNLWFILFMMDLLAKRYRRDNDGIFWKDWALFSKESLTQKYKKSSQLQKEEINENVNQDDEDNNDKKICA
jgi:hypothetical protein